MAQSSPAARKSTMGSNGNLGRPQNGNVAVQSMSSSAKEKLREEMAKKLAQLQRERLAEEERERQKRYDLFPWFFFLMSRETSWRKKTWHSYHASGLLSLELYSADFLSKLVA